MQSMVETPSSYFNIRSSNSLSFFGGGSGNDGTPTDKVSNSSSKDMLKYDSIDNYTMHNIQRQIIQSAMMDSNATEKQHASRNQPNQNVNNNTKNKYPLVNGFVRQITELEAIDSTGEPFRNRLASSKRYGHVKSKVDSNLRNLNLRGRSARNNNSNDDENADDQYRRIQTNILWRNTNSQRMRSLSASPHIQHSPKQPPTQQSSASSSSSSNDHNAATEPIPSAGLPNRSRSASMNDTIVSSLMPSDFETYAQTSSSSSSALNEKNNNIGVNDSIRLYRSYIQQKRGKHTSQEASDSFSTMKTTTRPKDQARENTYSGMFSQINHKPPTGPSPKPHEAFKKHYHQAEATTGQSIPLFQLLPQAVSQKPSIFHNRPISEHFTSSTDRRNDPMFFNNANAGPFGLQQRPVSEYQKSSSTAVDHKLQQQRDRSIARFNYNLPDPSNLILPKRQAFQQPHQQHQQHQQHQHQQHQQNYAETFNFLKASEYLNESEKRLSKSLDSAQQQQEKSYSLSRHAGMVLDRLQLQQQQREHEQKHQKKLQQEQQELAERQEQQRLKDIQRIHDGQKRLETSESIIKKAEITLAENIRFLQQIQQQNKSLPPIPSLPTTKSSTTAHTDFPHHHMSWSSTHKESNAAARLQKLPAVESSSSNKPSLLSKNNSKMLSMSMPAYLNYTNTIFSGIERSKTIVKAPKILKKKKSVRIALENNRMHVYTPEIW